MYPLSVLFKPFREPVPGGVAGHRSEAPELGVPRVDAREPRMRHCTGGRGDRLRFGAHPITLMKIDEN